MPKENPPSEDLVPFQLEPGDQPFSPGLQSREEAHEHKLDLGLPESGNIDIYARIAEVIDTDDGWLDEAEKEAASLPRDRFESADELLLDSMSLISEHREVGSQHVPSREEKDRLSELHIPGHPFLSRENLTALLRPTPAFKVPGFRGFQFSGHSFVLANSVPDCNPSLPVRKKYRTLTTKQEIEWGRFFGPMSSGFLDLLQEEVLEARNQVKRQMNEKLLLTSSSAEADKDRTPRITDHDLPLPPFIKVKPEDIKIESNVIGKKRSTQLHQKTPEKGIADSSKLDQIKGVTVSDAPPVKPISITSVVPISSAIIPSTTPHLPSQEVQLKTSFLNALKEGDLSRAQEIRGGVSPAKLDFEIKQAYSYHFTNQSSLADLIRSAFPSIISQDYITFLQKKRIREGASQVA